MQSETSILRVAAEFDGALEAGERERLVACFVADCPTELLGARLEGHCGVRRPRVITVDGGVFVEGFGATGLLADGRCIHSRRREILTYRDCLVVSLRPWCNRSTSLRRSGGQGGWRPRCSSLCSARSNGMSHSADEAMDYGRRLMAFSTNSFHVAPVVSRLGVRLPPARKAAPTMPGALSWITRFRWPIAAR